MNKHLPLIAVVMLSACAFGVASLARADDPVDLTGKKGIVDPADVKKNDPAPPKLVTHEPPPPPTPQPARRPSEVGAVRD
jgi:hypothetical protein